MTNWKLLSYPSSVYVIDGGDTPVCYINTHFRSKEAAVADGALIAAAPQLALLVEEMAGFHSDQSSALSLKDWLKSARQTLAQINQLSTAKETA